MKVKERTQVRSFLIKKDMDEDQRSKRSGKMFFQRHEKSPLYCKDMIA